MNKIFTAIVLLLISISLIAQTGTIKGKVYNPNTNEPLEFANIIVEGTGTGATSDIDGNYTLNNLKPGFFKLVVSLIGFETTISPEIQVQGNRTSYMDIPVKESSLVLNEVLVRQTLNVKRIESPVSVIQIGVQDIEKSAGINRDVSKLIQTLPGVGITDPNRNDLIVRGGGPSENVFYLDEIEIPVINHFTTQGSSGGAVGIINPDFVRDISFYTGAFPANRSNALSSVMEIKQKEGSRDGLHTKISVGASDAALTFDGPVGKKSTFIASARQSYLQFLFNLIGLPFLPTYNDFQFKYKIDIDKKNQLSILGIGAIDDMTLNLNIKDPTESQNYILSYLPIYKQWNYTFGLVYKHFAETHYNTLVMSRNMLRNSNYKFQDNDSKLPKVFDYVSDEAENKIRFEQDFAASGVKFQWGAGLKYAHYNNETSRNLYLNNQFMKLEYQTDLNLFSYQTFAQYSDEFLSDRLKLSLGINLTGNNYNQNMSNPLNQISPRLSTSYEISNNLNFNANIGRYAMQPSYTTLGFRNANKELVNQNENLKYTVSNQAIAGLEYIPSNKVRITLESFYKEYENYPMSVAEGISMAGKGTDYGQIGDEEIVSTGLGHAYGIELLFKLMNWNKLNLTGTYTLFKSEFTDINGIYRPSTWDTRQIVNLIASYKLPVNWNISGRWRFSGGKPYSPLNSELSTLREAWDIRNQAYPDYTQYNSLRLPSTHQLDLRIDKEFYFKNWMLNLYTDVQNVYNFKTESAPIYTNLDRNGQAQINAQDPQRYDLREIKVVGGTILPTIGIIVSIN